MRIGLILPFHTTQDKAYRMHITELLEDQGHEVVTQMRDLKSPSDAVEILNLEVKELELADCIMVFTDYLKDPSVSFMFGLCVGKFPDKIAMHSEVLSFKDLNPFFKDIPRQVTKGEKELLMIYGKRNEDARRC